MKHPLLKVLLVLGGYAACVGLAALVVYLDSVFNAAVQAQNSPGMQAEGDSILFLGVLGLSSLAPTTLALFFLRPYPKFWKVFSILALGLALTGPCLEAVDTALRIAKVFTMPWGILSFFALVRNFASPFFLASWLLCALISPDRPARWRFLIAAGIEAFLCLYVAVMFIFFLR